MELKRGIITGCDKDLEMFLPWWFDHIQKHTSLPVAIIDYGLSDWGKRVAEKIGTLIPKQNISISACHHQPSEAYPAYRHEKRSVYLYKPFALKQSPFEHTLWLDVDCKVRANLDALFTSPVFSIAINESYGQKWAQTYSIFKSKQTQLLNTGVIAYTHDCPTVKAWAEKTLHADADYVLEDVLLSELIAEENLPVHYLPMSYNTHWPDATSQTHIIHYMTHLGKAKILEEMMAKVCGAEI